MSRPSSLAASIKLEIIKYKYDATTGSNNFRQVKNQFDNYARSQCAEQILSGTAILDYPLECTTSELKETFEKTNPHFLAALRANREIALNLYNLLTASMGDSIAHIMISFTSEQIGAAWQAVIKEFQPQDMRYLHGMMVKLMTPFASAPTAESLHIYAEDITVMKALAVELDVNIIDVIALEQFLRAVDLDPAMSLWVNSIRMTMTMTKVPTFMEILSKYLSDKRALEHQAICASTTQSTALQAQGSMKKVKKLPTLQCDIHGLCHHTTDECRDRQKKEKAMTSRPPMAHYGGYGPTVPWNLPPSGYMQHQLPQYYPHQQMQYPPYIHQQQQQEPHSFFVGYVAKPNIALSVQPTSVVNFVVDSGANGTFIGTNDSHMVVPYKHATPQLVATASGDKFQTSGLGRIVGTEHVIGHCEGAPFSHNLLSVSQLDRYGKKGVAFVDGVVVILTPSGAVLLKAFLKQQIDNGNVLISGNREADDTYRVNVTVPSTSSALAARGSISPASLIDYVYLLQRRFGCMSSTRTLSLIKQQENNLANPLIIPNRPSDAEMLHILENTECALIRSAAAAIPRPHRALKDRSRFPNPYALLHIDLKYFDHLSYFSHRYALVIVDDMSREKHSLALKNKNELLPRLRTFILTHVRPRGHNVRFLRLDNAGEAKGAQATKFFEELSICPQYSQPYESEENGIAERGIGVLVASARVYQHLARWPESSWVFTMPTSAYLDSLTGSRSNPDHKSPYEILNGHPPDLSHLRAFGCAAYVFTHKHKRSTMGAMARLGFLCGYANGKEKYVYRILMDITKGTFIESSNVRFHENLFYGDRGLINSTRVSEENTVIPAYNLTFSRQQPSLHTADAMPTLVDRNVENDQDDVPQLIDNDDDDYDANDIPDSDIVKRVTFDTNTDVRPNANVTVTTRTLRSRKSGGDSLASLHQHHNHDAQVNEALSLNLHSLFAYKDCIFLDEDNQLLRLYAPTPNHSQANMIIRRCDLMDAAQDPRVKAEVIRELTMLLDGKIIPIDIDTLPPNTKLLGSGWIIKEKFDSNNKVDRIKARFAPMGNQQKLDIHFTKDETYASTVAMISVFICFALQVQRGMYCANFDADCAFAIPKLPEHTHIYLNKIQGMEFLPDGQNLKNKVFRVLHSLNGLKQGAYHWQRLAIQALLAMNFIMSSTDNCLFFNWSPDRILTLVALYVDDFRAWSDSEIRLQSFITHMKQTFPGKSPDPEMFLSIRCKHDRNNHTLLIDQVPFIQRLLAKFGMTDCKPINTPMMPHEVLIRRPLEEGPDPALLTNTSVSTFDVSDAVGSTLWLARCTEHQMQFAVKEAGSHVNNPTLQVVQHAKRMLRYTKFLLATNTAGITMKRCMPSSLLPNNVPRLIGYADANFAGETEDKPNPMRSTTGLTVGFEGIGPIHSSSKLQPTIERNTAGAEYRAGGAMTQVMMGVRNTLEELHLPQTIASTILNDNQAAIAISESRTCGTKSRHIKLDHHYVRQERKRGNVEMLYCREDFNISDLHTKPLVAPVFTRLTTLIKDGANFGKNHEGFVRHGKASNNDDEIE